MPFTYEDAVQHLLWLGHEGRPERSGLKWDLNNIRAVLGRLSHPERSFASVHIAGTNGKGSVAALLASLLRAAGYRTGLYTSPHLVRMNERIQVNGAQIADPDFAAAFTAVEREGEALLARGALPDHPSYFETLTAMAFWHFQQAGVEVAVLEAGMGGRLDATNVVTPRVAVITQIDFDHERFLGHSLEQIAGEKAGILKPGVPVVSAAEHRVAQRIIRARAAEVGAPLVELDATCCVEKLRAVDLGRYEFELVADAGFRLWLAPALRGRVQVRNAATAVAAARLLTTQGMHVPPAAIARGIAEVNWPGRLEHVARAPEVFLDGAHNPAAMRELLRFWDEHCRGRNIHLVFASMRDKAIEEIADLIFPRAASLILTQVRSPRAASAAALARLARTLHANVVVEPEPERALARACALARSGPADMVFVTGSLYLVGEMKRALAARELAPVEAARVVAASEPSSL
ncbi:MAG: bifunctional folylpolyglutamate synthase/dihydrofolate synthase [Terriglobia bacterium]